MSANQFRKGERGNAVITLMMMTVLVGSTALVIDIGHVRFVQAQLQNAVDAAALAGAAELNLQQDGMTEAVRAARYLGDLNAVNNVTVGFQEEDVTLGIYDDGVFTPSSDPLQVNAVQVTKQVTDTQTVFASVAFGTDTLMAGAQSIAALPPPEPATASDCFLPLAIPDCRFADETSPGEIMDLTFQMTSANADNAAWALPQSDNPSDAEIRESLQEPCQATDDPMGDGRVSLNSGAMANAFRATADLVNESPVVWNADRWGALPDQMDGSAIRAYGDHVVEGAIMMFVPPDGYCTDADGDGAPDGGGFIEDDLEISGLAWAVLFDVKPQGGRSAAGNLAMRLDLDYDGALGTSGGGAYDGGVMFQENARLVR